MQLSKIVPARRNTVKFEWCKKDFMVMNQKFRDVRAQLKKPMDSCFWCRHKFIDGEMMALAAPKGKLNKVLCQTCANELLDAT